MPMIATNTTRILDLMKTVASHNSKINKFGKTESTHRFW